MTGTQRLPSICNVLGLLAAAFLACGVGLPIAAGAQTVPTGFLSVMNHTVGLPGVALPTAYTITTTCTPSPLVYPWQAVWVHVANDGIGGPIPAPNTCTITAAPLAPIGHVQACNGGDASWTTTITPGTVTVPVGSSFYVAVQNTLNCNAPPPGGHLTVRKAVINTIGAQIPASFSLTAHCTPAGPIFPPSPVGAGQSVSLAQLIPANSSCNVTESPLAPIANVQGCGGGSASWTTTYTPATVTVPAGANPTITVTNALQCNPAPGKGSLLVLKSVNNATGMPVQTPATFAVKVDCTPSGPHQPIPVPVGAVGATVANIPAPSQCTVTEPTPAPIAHVEGCHGGSASWTTVIAPAQPINIVASGTTTVEVRNTLTCGKP